MREPTYEDGVRDGELRALQDRMQKAEDKIDHHEQRLKILERIAWILVGVFGFIQVYPGLVEFFKQMTVS